MNGHKQDRKCAEIVAYSRRLVNRPRTWRHAGLRTIVQLQGIDSAARPTNTTFLKSLHLNHCDTRHKSSNRETITRKESTMEMQIVFPGEAQVDAVMPGGMVITTDQDGSAPA